MFNFEEKNQMTKKHAKLPSIQRITLSFADYSKTCLKRPLKKKTKIGFQDRLLLNAGQKYCRMLQGEHSAILSTFIELTFIINIFVLSIFEWLHKTGFTVGKNSCSCQYLPYCKKWLI